MIENMLYDIGKYKNHYIYLEKCKDIVSELSKMVQEILDTSKLNIINNKNERQIIYPSYYFFDLIKFIYVIANKYRWKYKIWKRKSYDNRT